MPNVAPTPDPRGLKAITILAVDKWQLFRDAEGRPSWRVPSARKPGLHYRVTDDSCTCPDLRHRPWVACKHMLAIRLYLAETF